MNLKLSQGVLLEGLPGLSMLDDAISGAEEYLNSKNLSKHPDFLLISLPEGKKSIGVEDITEFQRKAYLRPAIAQKQVVIIDGIDLFTIQAQNKILKILEDCSTVIVVAIAYSNNVLATIKSRLVPISYRPLTENEFLSLDLPKKERIDRVILHRLCGGSPGMIEFVLPYFDMYKEIYTIINSGDLKRLLPCLHLLKEKDKEAVPSEQYVVVIRFLISCISEIIISNAGIDSNFIKSNCFNRQKLKEMEEVLSKDSIACLSTGYTKDNFFNMIVKIVEKGGVPGESGK